MCRKNKLSEEIKRERNNLLLKCFAMVCMLRIISLVNSVDLLKVQCGRKNIGRRGLECRQFAVTGVE